MFNQFVLLLLILFVSNYIASSDSPSHGLVVSEFPSEVIESSQVWLIEYYSDMCGSCQEFRPTWNKLTKAFEREIKIGKVNIDEKEGMKLAQKNGVLDIGIPHIKLYDTYGDGIGKSIEVDDSSTYKALLKKIRKLLAGYDKNDADGFYKKKS